MTGLPSTGPAFDAKPIRMNSNVSLGAVIRPMPVKPPAARRGIARSIDTSVPSEPDRF
jgi:hypothetical protein